MCCHSFRCGRLRDDAFRVPSWAGKVVYGNLSARPQPSCTELAACEACLHPGGLGSHSPEKGGREMPVVCLVACGGRHVWAVDTPPAQVPSGATRLGADAVHRGCLQGGAHDPATLCIQAAIICIQAATLCMWVPTTLLSVPGCNPVHPGCNLCIYRCSRSSRP